MKENTLIEAVKYLYLQSRKATLTAEEHDTCTKCFQAVVAGINNPQSGEINQEPKETKKKAK